MQGLNNGGVARVPGTNWFSELPKRDRWHFVGGDAAYIQLSDMIITSTNFMRHEVALRAMAYHATMVARDRAAERLAEYDAMEARTANAAARYGANIAHLARGDR